MQSVCFHFLLNQPYRLKTYRFFDINQKHDYFDDYQNNYLAKRIAERCYLPANKMLLELIERYGKDISFSFTINSLNLFEEYSPEVIESFQALLKTGQVEITGSTYSNSIASLHNKTAFMEQVSLQEEKLKKVFGIEKPVSFCNTECIYSDEIGEWLYDAGYKVVLTEGAKHILGWKSPGYLYCNPYQTDLKLLLRNYKLCDDITFRFEDQSWNQYPLTAEKYIGYLKKLPKDAPYINLYFDYETIGEYHTQESGIFDFFRALFSNLAESSDFKFISPKEIAESTDSCATMHTPWPISGSGDEKDTNEWVGNELQQEAFKKLFDLEPLYNTTKNKKAKESWLLMQTADHFNFMATKWFPQQSVKRNFDVYASPYQAFINYMNIINDLELQMK